MIFFIYIDENPQSLHLIFGNIYLIDSYYLRVSAKTKMKIIQEFGHA